MDFDMSVYTPNRANFQSKHGIKIQFEQFQ